jgi:hypothetical protein
VTLARSVRRRHARCDALHGHGEHAPTESKQRFIFADDSPQLPRRDVVLAKYAQAVRLEMLARLETFSPEYQPVNQSISY